MSETKGKSKTNCLSNADLSAMPEVHIPHSFKSAPDVYFRWLSPSFGLERLAHYISPVPPGKESFAYHRFERDEVFLLIPPGRSCAEIGEEQVDVGPGDIMAFPAPDGPAHHLTNPCDEGLVCHMAGECSEFKICDFPRIGRQLIFADAKIWNIGDSDTERITFDRWNAP